MIDDYESLKRKVEDLKARRDQAKGAFGQMLKRLKTEFNCSSIKDAEVLLEKLSQQERTVAVKYTEVKKKFLKKWRKVLK